MTLRAVPGNEFDSNTSAAVFERALGGRKPFHWFVPVVQYWAILVKVEPC